MSTISKSTSGMHRYPGIRPFKMEEGPLFFGRSKEIKDMVNSIKVHELFVLFGKSGLGKSSLLNAGILPRMARENLHPVVIRFLDPDINPLVSILNEVKSTFPSEYLAEIPQEYQNNLWVLFNRWPYDAQPVLIFDQFEEFFYCDAIKRDSTITAISELLSETLPDSFFSNYPGELSDQVLPTIKKQRNVKMLFLIRSDKLSLLEELSNRFPSILHNRYELKPLGFEMAEQAIVLPAQLRSTSDTSFRTKSFDYSLDALQIILEVLGNNIGPSNKNKKEVESSQLQIICQEMELIADDLLRNTENLIIEPFHFGGSQGVKSILNQFYGKQINKLKTSRSLSLVREDMQVIYRLLEIELLSGKKRISQAEERVKELLRLVKPDVLLINGIRKEDALIDELLDMRLIREEETHLGKVYEISHDTLVESIIRERDKRKREENELYGKKKKPIETVKLQEKQFGSQRTCFVIMGFGTKTDYATGRKLDLNKTYRLLIKPVVESKGLLCIRADEIRHSGSIDLPIYQYILQADLVIVDLSTANINACYELGLRHAVSPSRTIVISEDKLSYPFDLNHIKINSYTHLGEGIEYQEVERFRSVLSENIERTLSTNEVDSPLYTYVDGLIPPNIQDVTKEHSILKEEAQKASVSFDHSLQKLTQDAENAMKSENYEKAKALYQSLNAMAMLNIENTAVVDAVYVNRQLALATINAGIPDASTALIEGLSLIERLDLQQTNDPETIKLAAKIEKKMFLNGLGNDHLFKAIEFYERGYHLSKSGYMGNGLAFTLNCRAAAKITPNKAERIADLINANRVRKAIITISEKDLQDLELREHQAILISDNDERKEVLDQKKLVLLNMAEAYFGLGENTQFVKTLNDAKKFNLEKIIMEEFSSHITYIGTLIDENMELLKEVEKNL